MSKKSRSASARQPVAQKPLWAFQDYPTTDGRPAISCQIDIRDYARFYAEDPRLAGQYETDWSSATSQYIPQYIRNADQAIDAMEAFQFPLDLKRAAQRAAAQLTSVFADVARLQRVNDLTAGRLDRRKFATMARHTAAGTYDVNQVRPYCRTQPTPVQKPTIAIVASAGWGEMWKNRDYIPRVMTLTLGLLWACEAAGLNTCAALTQDNIGLRRAGLHYREGVRGIMLARPGQTVSPRAYGVALHRDLFRHGEMTAQVADYDSNLRFGRLRGESGPADIGYSWTCLAGGSAVNWARQVLKADVVIAIGAIRDKADADIVLAADFRLDEAVQSVVIQAGRLAG